ncbi:sugar transferase [Okibacterium endophyticum]
MSQFSASSQSFDFPVSARYTRYDTDRRNASASSASSANSASSVDSVASGMLWARRYRAKLIVTDLSVIVVTLLVVCLTQLAAVGFSPATARSRVELVLVPLTIAVFWTAALAIAHSRMSHVVGSGAEEYKRVAVATTFAILVPTIYFLMIDVHAARGYPLVTLPAGVVGLLLGRWLWRKWLLNQRRYGHYLSRALVVGQRDEVKYAIRQIAEKSGAAYHVVGVALERFETDALSAAGRSIPVVSDVEHAAEGAARVGADTVIVAGQPSVGSDYIRTLSWQLEGTATELVLSSRLTDVAGPRIHFRPVEGLPLIQVEIPTFDGTKHVMKRAFDIVASSLGIVVLIPLLLAIAIAIKMDSDGPVLFRQERVGRNGRSFSIFKFRSMVVTAEQELAALLAQNEGAGQLFKMRDDPRVTRVGRVLRKYSLDELPQIWNVLRGDMSLVGPRPPLPREVEGYEDHVNRRLFIKPGITGMWQVSGRSDLSWEESVRLDLYYVENWSLTGDLMLIWRTFKTVVRPAGAY